MPLKVFLICRFIFSCIFVVGLIRSRPWPFSSFFGTLTFLHPFNLCFCNSAMAIGASQLVFLRVHLRLNISYGIINKTKNKLTQADSHSTMSVGRLMQAVMRCPSSALNGAERNRTNSDYRHWQRKLKHIKSST